MIGQSIGHFRVESLAGEGAMGRVYRALDTALDRPVALKCMRTDLMASEAARRRFAREARAAARLSHPNITTVYEIFEHDEQLIIVSEWIDGKTLDGMTFKSPEQWPALLSILEQIASGLDAAHQAGIIHRDLKPANIMLTAKGQVKLCDFGIARVLDTKSSFTDLVGTPNRIAPEQWLGESFDHRVDIFALAVLAYELLAGKAPFAGHQIPVLYNQIVNEPHPAASLANFDLSDDMDAALSRGLAKKPSDRPASASDFIALVRGALKPRRSATEGHWTLRSPMFRRRWALVVVPTFIAVVVLLLSIVEGASERLAITHFRCATSLWSMDAPCDYVARELNRVIAESTDIEIVSYLRLGELASEPGRENAPRLEARNAREVARRAGAKWLLHGWVERVDSSLIISSELCDVSSGSPLCHPRAAARLSGDPDKLIHVFAAEVARAVDSLRSRRRAEAPRS